MARGITTTQEAVTRRKIQTFIENHWEAPTTPSLQGDVATMFGRLTDEYGNPLSWAGLTVALHIIEPDGVEYDIHGIPTDSNGVMQHNIVMAKVGIWQAWYWYGGDVNYEGCPEGEPKGEPNIESIVGKFKWG